VTYLSHEDDVEQLESLAFLIVRAVRAEIDHPVGDDVVTARIRNAWAMLRAWGVTGLVDAGFERGFVDVAVEGPGTVVGNEVLIIATWALDQPTLGAVTLLD
jgi:hypothetical protein